eukprot:4468764-Prymnesium_polylepis.1
MVHSEFKQQPPTEPKRLRRPTEKVAASVHLSPMRNHPNGNAGGSSKRRRKADQTYQVEKIIAERSRNGGTEFQVCWLGYSRGHDSWEPETNVSTHTCQTFFPTYLVCVVSLDLFLHRICPHPIQIQILDPGLISAFRGEVFAPLLAPLLAPKRALVRSVRRAAITIGTEAQACIQPSIESVRPPPAEPPRCPCNHPDGGASLVHAPMNANRRRLLSRRPVLAIARAFGTTALVVRAWRCGLRLRAARIPTRS